MWQRVDDHARHPGSPTAETGTALTAFVNDNWQRFGVILVPGFLLLTLGSLLLAVALWRARSVPRWLPVAVGLINVVTFAIPFGPVLDGLDAAFSATMIAIAWYLWRGSRAV